jgi:hypothetical protein
MNEQKQDPGRSDYRLYLDENTRAAAVDQAVEEVSDKDAQMRDIWYDSDQESDTTVCERVANEESNAAILAEPMNECSDQGAELRNLAEGPFQQVNLVEDALREQLQPLIDKLVEQKTVVLQAVTAKIDEHKTKLLASLTAKRVKLPTVTLLLPVGGAYTKQLTRNNRPLPNHLG